MVASIVWAVVVAVLLLAVSVGWAMRGAVLVRESLPVPSQRMAATDVRPAWLAVLCRYRYLVASGLLLTVALIFFALSLNRNLPLMAALVLSFTYAVLSATVTGFTVWVRMQQHVHDGRRLFSETSRWAMWVGVGIAVLAVAYLVLDLVTNLPS